jgi:ADP-glucose pyrophosphorylase
LKGNTLENNLLPEAEIMEFCFKKYWQQVGEIDA